MKTAPSWDETAFALLKILPIAGCEQRLYPTLNSGGLA
jgi:hypothetical protein